MCEVKRNGGTRRQHTLATAMPGTIVLVALLGAVGVGAAGSRDTLIGAVKEGNVNAARALVQQHADVNASDPDGTTALHWAAHQDDLQTADLLIRAGARVDAANRYGVTPLMLACTNGNAVIVARLLKGGADQNLRVPGGETLVMTAARTGKVEAIKVLLAYGADVNARESTRGQTALMWAAAEGNPAAIAVLVEGGADVNARSRGPKPASEHKQASEVSYLGKGTPGSPADGQKLNGRPASADLVASLNDATSRDYARSGRVDDYTPLLFAARAGHLDAVRALLQAGANVNDTASDGASALVIAAINAHWELGALLIDHGVDPNAAAPGWTPLHQVVRTRTLSIGQFPHPVATGHVSGLELARTLIQHGADVNARMTKDLVDGYRNRFNRKGATPLMLAAKGADFEMMRLLTANGADPQLTTVEHATILMAAAGIDMFYVNEDSGTNEDAVEAVKVALALGLDVNAANDRGDTALHGAAARGSNPIVQLLVDRGARLDAKNTRGLTPLNVANGDGNTSTFQRRPETVALFRDLMLARGFTIDESAFVSPTVRDSVPAPQPKPDSR